MAAEEVQVAGEVNRMIQVEVNGIYKRLETYDAYIAFGHCMRFVAHVLWCRLRQQAKFPSFASVNIPMVLVLGNHSSGKSTFINHMLQQDVQKTGTSRTIRIYGSWLTLFARTSANRLHVHCARGR